MFDDSEPPVSAAAPRVVCGLPVETLWVAFLVEPGATVRMRWYAPSGWAHLAVHVPGSGRAPVFAGFARFPVSTVDDLRELLVRAGCTVLSEYPDPGGICEVWVRTATEAAPAGPVAAVSSVGDR